MSRVALTLFTELLREEWRLHARLFGGRRFLPFPLLVALLAAGATAGAYVGGTEVAALHLGAHVLVFGFGLYTGTAGLVGTELIERVLGDVTLLLSASRTLPVSRRTLLGLFLVKDACYYAVLFLLPVAVGFAPLVFLDVVALSSLPWLWGSLAVVFAAGMVLTVGAIALWTRGIPGRVVGFLLGLGTVVLGSLGLLGRLWDALVIFDAGPLGALGVITGILLLGGLALVGYDPTFRRPARTRTDRFRAVERRLPLETKGLVTKTLLDVGRSSGGFAKPVVSVALLFALVAFLVDLVRSIVGLQPATGVFFGGVLALSSFTTYSWLTQFDSVADYLLLPVSVADVFRAKRIAFLVLGIPTAGLGYLGALVVFPTTLVDALLGAVVLTGCALYFYGLTVYVAGFSPNEFLFDTVRFLAFFVGVAVPLVPLLLVGFVLVPRALSLSAAAGTALACVGLGALGVWLSGRAAEKWGATYHAG